MAENYGWLPRIDVGPLTAIGRGLRNRMALHDFSGDYEDAAQRLMQMGLVDEATRLYTAGQLAKYRDIQGQVQLDKSNEDTRSLDERIYDDYRNSIVTDPMRLSPEEADHAEANEAAGVTSPPTARPMPGMLEKKLLPIEEQAKRKATGTGEGTRESFRAGLKEASPQLQGLVDSLVAQVRESDTGTFGHALGPFQGSQDQDDWRSLLQGGLPQLFGSAANYLEKGWDQGFLGGEGKDLHIKGASELEGGNTYTLRSKIQSTQASLVGIMQRLLRVPGIGAQSDYELRQIIAQTGELSKAQDKADFQDRLQNVLGNLKAIGFDINVPDVEQVTGMPSQTKSADRYTNPADAANAGSVPWDQNVTEDTMVGGANIGRTTRQPPTPPQRALNALKAYRNNPQARAAFDEIYGPGASDFYLQKYR